jgi:transcriptional regulator with XRE-family HTH domain
MATTPDPTVLRRRLRNELRRAREARHLTQREVAEAMDWSLSKLIRIETGQVSIGTNDLKALLAHYGITDGARVSELIETARASRQRSWWNSYRDVASSDFLAAVAYESSAEYIRNFEPILIPGLLQTEEYAQTVISVFGAVRKRSSRDINRLVKFRLERQERVLRNDSTHMIFILDEAVIRRVVGSPLIMHEQLDHLLMLDKQGNVTILIMPFDAGLHTLSTTPMVHYGFAGADDEDVLYLEGPLEQSIIVRESTDDSQQLSPSAYLDHFWTLEHAAREHDATALIRSAMDNLAKP